MIQRNTVQRTLVLDAVRKLRSHVTAEEVYEEVIKSYPNVSRATVYRNLNKLAQEGKVGKMEISGEPDRFDYITEKHYHVKCEECGGIFDVKMEYIPGLESRIEDRQGFEILGHEILFRGICPDCRKKKTGDKPE